MPQGQLMLRQQISRMLVQHGLDVTYQWLQRAVSSSSLLCQTGDWVIESYLARNAIALYNIKDSHDGRGHESRVVGENLYTYRPLIFTVSTLHNPTGITTSQSRRQLLQLAERYNCVILEDNAYEGLNFEPVPAPLRH